MPNLVSHSTSFPLSLAFSNVIPLLLRCKWIFMLGLIYFNSFVKAGQLQCFGTEKICFSAKFSSSNESIVEMNLTTSISLGWLSIGLGSSMESSNMWIFWKKNSRTWTYSERISKSKSTPIEKNTTSVVYFNGTVPKDNLGREIIQLHCLSDPGFQSLRFKRLPVSMIYAWYDGIREVSNTDLPLHTSAGNFTYDLMQENTEKEDEKIKLYRRSMLQIHGVLMSFAWVFLSFSSFFVARFFKFFFPYGWWKLHIGLNLSMFVFTFVSLTVAILGMGFSLKSTHAQLGISMICLLLFQVFLGGLIHFSRTHPQATPSIGDRFHWLVGYSLLVLGLVNVVLGHLQHDSPISLVLFDGIVILLFTLFFILGEWYFQKYHALPLESSKLSSKVSPMPLSLPQRRLSTSLEANVKSDVMRRRSSLLVT